METRDIAEEITKMIGAKFDVVEWFPECDCPFPLDDYGMREMEEEIDKILKKMLGGVSLDNV